VEEEAPPPAIAPPACSGTCRLPCCHARWLQHAPGPPPTPPPPIQATSRLPSQATAISRARASPWTGRRAAGAGAHLHQRPEAGAHGAAYAPVRLGELVGGLCCLGWGSGWLLPGRPMGRGVSRSCVEGIRLLRCAGAVVAGLRPPLGAAPERARRRRRWVLTADKRRKPYLWAGQLPENEPALTQIKASSPTLGGPSDLESYRCALAWEPVCVCWWVGRVCVCVWGGGAARASRPRLLPSQLLRLARWLAAAAALACWPTAAPCYDVKSSSRPAAHPQDLLPVHVPAQRQLHRHAVRQLRQRLARRHAGPAARPPPAPCARGPPAPARTPRSWASAAAAVLPGPHDLARSSVPDAPRPGTLRFPPPPCRWPCT
jgi:hypothetical protein